MSLRNEQLTEKVIGAAIQVHRQLGPGLLESAYRRCLAHELRLREGPVEQEVVLDMVYKGLRVPNCYRLDLLVADALVVEVKSVDTTLPIHEAQLLTYLRVSGRRVGLLLNFKSRLLKDGIIRRAL